MYITEGCIGIVIHAARVVPFQKLQAAEKDMNRHRTQSDEACFDIHTRQFQSYEFD